MTGILTAAILLGALPCLFAIVMLAAGVSKRKLALVLGLPAAALLVYGLVLLARWDGIRGELPPGWLLALLGDVFIFGPALTLLGGVALYRRYRAGQGKKRPTSEQVR